MSWDAEADIEKAKNYPVVESERIEVSTQEVRYGTFEQRFDDVFEDFPHRGDPLRPSAEGAKTDVKGTRYSVSYDGRVLRVFRENALIVERTLPNAFSMHAMNSAVVLSGALNYDRIILRTRSRATTGLHYILIVDGGGQILFEKVVNAEEDWDISQGQFGELIIGGARSKMIITFR